ncbi:MAG TPA: efflux RND transporter periplasmic adaptor subunit [Verrucomicrobiae bacterium]
MNESGEGDGQRPGKGKTNSPESEQAEEKDESKETAEENRKAHRERRDSEKEESQDDEREQSADDTDSDRGGSDEKPGKEKSEEGKRKKPPVYKRPAFIISAIVILTVFVVGAIIVWLYVRHFVWTDDAYVDGHVVQIAPQVSAPVQALHFDDNWYVHKGDLLVELDPADYQAASEQAQAQLDASRTRVAQTLTQIESAKAAVAEAAAQLDSAQVSLDNAKRDLRRYQEVDEAARSRQQLDNAATAEKNAEAQLHQAEARKASAEANVKTSIAAEKSAEADVGTAMASLKRAQVSLGYCKIHAPCDGRITERTVEAGNFAQVSQTMFMIVSPYVWVTANFKETQLTYMRPGDEVQLKVDAFPNLKLHGHVDSIQAGSGARFGILPPENATGNFVKIVQRVPVKLVFDIGPNTNDTELISPGLSVVPRVRIR